MGKVRMTDIIGRKVPDYLKTYFGEDSQFHYYYEHEKYVKTYRNIEDQFICLKGFSSSTPIVRSATFESDCIGGGFYFRYHGIGIAVDPGIGFVSLMHKNNIFIDDIDIVIVTHDHIDHNCDVNSLSALVYDYNKNKSKEIEFYKNFFKCNEWKEHKIQWYMDDSTISRTKALIDEKYVHPLSEIQEKGIKEEIAKGIWISVIETKHLKNIRDTYGLKICFTSENENYIWGYTSDTRYFDALSDFMSDCDIVLFNISDIYEKDIAGIKPKSGHLGFDGSVKLLSSLTPGIAVATEFCCMNGDRRHEIVKALRDQLGSRKMTILPADPGLALSISGEQFRCTLCKGQSNIGTIKVARPGEEFGKIRYICPKCLI